MTNTNLENIITPKNSDELANSVGKIINFFLTSTSEKEPVVYKSNDGKREEHYKESINISADTFVMQNTRNGKYEESVFVLIARNRFNEYRENGVFPSFALEVFVVEPSHKDWKNYEIDVNKLKAKSLWKQPGLTA